jgi:hypothetical protein
MRNKLSIKLVVLTLVLITAMFSFTGCETFGTDPVMAFFDDLLYLKYGVDTEDTSGTAKVTYVWSLRTVISPDTSTGDSEADAALGAIKLVKNIVEADNLMEKGRKNGDGKVMEDAIKMRPHDWTYTSSRAALALKQGDKNNYYEFHSRSVDDVVSDKNTGAMERYYHQTIIETEPVVNGQHFEQLPNELQAEAYSNLAEAYKNLADSPKNRYNFSEYNNANNKYLEYRAKYEAFSGKKLQ